MFLNHKVGFYKLLFISHVLSSTIEIIAARTDMLKQYAKTHFVFSLSQDVGEAKI